ncbi:RNase H family protein [Arthrobacter rhizosphaerae]|uniref:RNase H family protein n=1 Tax=Arthrobacter rhizosphaerae TaxID=2855490 RepID=UPI001FF3270C|nr:ribonuclease HI family protein [Arthrobacter rhizosphaerae]
MTIIAAADGSALGNPGPAGWAWFVDEDCWRAGGWPHGTNNQGELMAVLDLFRATAHLPDEDLRILCDSQYVINSVTKWMPGWKRKGWRKADGKPVLNVDLLKEIDQALIGRKYSFEWVRGHAGHALNEAADERARAAATAYQQGIAVRNGPGFESFAGSETLTRGPEDIRQPDLRKALPAVAVPPKAGTSGANPSHGYGEAALYEEPDLFSELDADPFALQSVAESAPEAIVEELERELLTPEARADIGRTGVLLHRDFTEIGSSGRLWTRDAMMTELEENPGLRTELELLAADRICSTAVLLTYRGHTRAGTTLRSSLWVLEGTQWRIRFHQSTNEV